MIYDVLSSGVKSLTYPGYKNFTKAPNEYKAIFSSFWAKFPYLLTACYIEERAGKKKTRVNTKRTVLMYFIN